MICWVVLCIFCGLVVKFKWINFWLLGLNYLLKLIVSWYWFWINVFVVVGWMYVCKFSYVKYVFCKLVKINLGVWVVKVVYK